MTKARRWASGGKDLAYFRMRVGADEAEPLQLGQSVQFPSADENVCGAQMPDPRDAEYESALEHWIEHFVGKTDGHAFVLFAIIA